MRCGACAHRVEKIAGDLDGVSAASVNFATERLDLEYDPARIDLPAIGRALRDGGYDIRNTIEPQPVLLPNGGMRCAACAARVENLVDELDGVEAIAVNLLTDSATIRFDPATISLAQIADRIRDAGFEPEPVEVRLPDERRQQEREAELLAQRNGVLTALAFTLPLLVLAMGHMIGLPLPAWLAPSTAPMNFTVTQLVLTLPVIWVGRRIYRSGARLLWQRAPNMDSLILLGTGCAML